MKKIFLLIGLLNFICGLVEATAQFPDIIFYAGKKYALFSNPLEKFFKLHPELRPTPDCISTALWRGYIAKFEVLENRLILKDILVELEPSEEDQKNEEMKEKILKDVEGIQTNIGAKTKIGLGCRWKSVLDKIFPGGKDVLADWFSGILVLPYGDLVEYEHMGYLSLYEYYVLLEMRSGLITANRSFNCQEFKNFKEQQIRNFCKTEEYQKIKEEYIGQLKAESEDLQEVDQFDFDSFLTEFIFDFLPHFIDE